MRVDRVVAGLPFLKVLIDDRCLQTSFIQHLRPFFVS